MIKNLGQYCRIGLSVLSLHIAQTCQATETETDVDYLFSLALEDLLNIEVISPSQSSKKIVRAPSIVSSITAAQIEAMGANTLSEVLKMLPGIQLLNRRNGQDMIWIRGIPSGRNTKVMLMIDGVPQREVIFGGWSSDEQIQINNIERIEVIRGPGSALYGGDAYSGLISIYTKEQLAEKSSISAGIASFDSQQVQFDTGMKIDSARLLFSGRYFHSQGYDQQRDRTGMHSSHNNNVEAAGFTTKLMFDQITAAIVYDDYRTEYPLYSSTQYKEQRYQIISAYLSNKTAQFGFTIENQLYWYQVNRFFDQTIDNEDKTLNYASYADLDSRLLGFRSQWRYALNEQHHFTLGAVYEKRSVHHYHETITQLNNEPVLLLQSFIEKNGDRSPTANNYALYTQIDSLFFDQTINITTGIRVDHFEEFDQKVSPRIAITYQKAENWSGKLTWGKAFRAPTLLQQYEIRSNVNSPGNPQVTPELIKTVEAELVYHRSSTDNISLRGFNSQLTDFMQSMHGAPYENVSTPVTVPGYELEWNAKINSDRRYLNELGYSVNYTRVNTGQASVAKNSANLILFAEDDAMALYLGINYLGHRNASDSYHDHVTPPTLKSTDNKNAYWIVDTNFRLKNRYHNALQLELKIKNIFDKQHYNPTYAPDSYYDIRKQPRSVEISLRYYF